MTKVVEYNCETKQETIREMNEAELELQSKIEADLAIADAAKIAKEATRQAVLDKLGLTAEEAAALLA